MSNFSFLEKDTKEVIREYDCYIDCLNKAIKHVDQKEYEEAITYFENIILSLKELDRLKTRKEQLDAIRKLFRKSDIERIKELL